MAREFGRRAHAGLPCETQYRFPAAKNAEKAEKFQRKLKFISFRRKTA